MIAVSTCLKVYVCEAEGYLLFSSTKRGELFCNSVESVFYCSTASQAHPLYVFCGLELQRCAVINCHLLN